MVLLWHRCGKPCIFKSVDQLFVLLREAALEAMAALQRLSSEEPRGSLEELQHPHADACGRIRPREHCGGWRGNPTPFRMSDDLLRGRARIHRGAAQPADGRL